MLGATLPSPGNGSRFWDYEGSCPAPQGELEERVGHRPQGGGSGGRQGRVGLLLPLQPAGPGRRPRPPRGRRCPSPCEEAARFPAAGAGDIGAPARARRSAAAPPRLLAARWPRSGYTAPLAARGSGRPALGDPQRFASSSCWAVSAAPGGPGGEGGWTAKAGTGPTLAADSALLQTLSHLREGAAASHLGKAGTPGLARREGVAV